MKATWQIAAALAVAAAATCFTACEVDESAPSHPRTAANLLTPDSKANDDAFNRETEKPQRELPTNGGGEFPGHSLANSERVIMADAEAPPAATLPATPTTVAPETAAVPAPARVPRSEKLVPVNGTDSKFPESRYPDNNWYPGPLPPLPEKPAGIMAGSTPVPGTGWSIDYSWGQVLPLENYPHRDWHDMQTTYVAADVKHNPVYYFNLQNRLAIPQDDATLKGSFYNALIEIPWFYAQSLALPVLMLIEPPFKQVTTQRLGGDPLYFGHQPAGGAIAPSMTPGIIRWDYPFLVPTKDGTPPPYAPITPTPGITLPPAPTTATSEPAAPATQPAATPGLN